MNAPVADRPARGSSPTASRIGPSRTAGRAGARLLAWSGALVAALDLVLYRLLLEDDGRAWLGSSGRVVPVLAIAGPAVLLAAAGPFLPRRAALAMVALSAGALLSMGLLALASIGLPLLISAGLATSAWRSDHSVAGGGGGRRWDIAAFLVGAGLPLVMIVFTGGLGS